MSTVKEYPLVLQVDASGIPMQWITYEESCYHITKGNVVWTMGDVEFDIFGGINAATGLRSKLTINTIIAIHTKIGSKAHDHFKKVPLSNRTLFRRDKNICAYCGNEFSSNHLTRDHVHPTSKGGRNIWTNVVTACGSCNKAKSDKTLEQSGMQLLYVPYEPNRSEWLILQNRKILADQMNFLIKSVPKKSRLLD